MKQALPRTGRALPVSHRIASNLPATLKGSQCDGQPPMPRRCLIQHKDGSKLVCALLSAMPRHICHILLSTDSDSPRLASYACTVTACVYYHGMPRTPVRLAKHGSLQDPPALHSVSRHRSRHILCLPLIVDSTVLHAGQVHRIGFVTSRSTGHGTWVDVDEREQ